MFVFIFTVIGILFCSVESSEVCYRRDVLGNAGYITCEDSCCGSLEDKYCCREKEVGIIAGSVVGAIVVLALTVTLLNCCCCQRNKRRGYEKVAEGPPNDDSNTYYDVPRTPSGPNISDHVVFIEDSNTHCKRRLDDETEITVDIEIATENLHDHVVTVEDTETDKNLTKNIIIENSTEENRNNEVNVETVKKLSADDLIVCGTEESVATEKQTPTIIVTDTDSPSGRHSYVKIKTENDFGENYNDFYSGTKHITEDGDETNIDEEGISDRSPLLYEVHDKYSHTADVYVDRNKSRTILVTDLDTDITEEIKFDEFETSGDLGESIKFEFADSEEGSILPDLTISLAESTASDVTVITKVESIVSIESNLPDLVISGEESLSSKSLPKEDKDTSMGNQSTSVEKVYVTDTQPVTTYVTSGPYPSNPVEAYRDEGPREEIVIEERDDRPIIAYTDRDDQPVIAYTDNSRPYDPGPAGAYAIPEPAGGASYNEPYGGGPMDAYHQPGPYQPADAYNQPMAAYHDNQPYRNDNPMNAYADNQPDVSVETSDPMDAYADDDDNPADAY